MNIESLIDNQYMELSEFIPFNLVLSDLAPNISGIREKDDAEMISLLKVVFKITEDVLKKKGSLLVKIFQGESFNFAKNYMDTNFEKVRIRKPSSSRSKSNETYLLATGRK
jgi:23S rRNA (uridine2552-2'-O)-methyltransferase